MSSDFAIKVENLSKCYHIYDKPRDRLLQGVMPRLQRMVGKEPKLYCKEFWALKDVSFEVKRGETVGIIGKNGSGKSTLLQMICGTLTPTSGNIKTNGRVAALLELGAGFNPEFTGRENVYMNASILGLSKEEIDARFEDIVEFADIGEFVEQPVKTYSSGMMVRLAFAVIAHVDADILVIDEALAVGDAFFTQKCMRFLRKFMENGTVLFVSHDTSAVINLCQRAVWLDKGQSTFQGTPKKAAELYLAAIYQEQQGESEIPADAITEDTAPEESNNEYRDMRLDYFNSTNLRNDVELFKFDPTAPSFGKGAATIESVIITDKNNMPLSWIVGGEMVKLKIYCKAHHDIYSPIVGFQLKDRLGQQIFGDISVFTDQYKALSVACGQRLVATFEFRFPVLQPGHYSISPAIAEGTLNDHIQHQWSHDALILQVHASSVCFGIIQIPMKQITLDVKN